MFDKDQTSIVMFPPEKELADGGKTVAVFGVARGGTSMVAGAVRGFGFFMGTSLPVNNEDPDFCYKPNDHMKRVIAARNEAHKNWGWKFPLASNYLDALLPAVRNPHLIIVFRDPIAVSARHNAWHGRDPKFALTDITMQTQKNIMLALCWRKPTLLVSYEKAANNPGRLLDELSSFLGEEISVKREMLMDYIAPGSYKKFEDIVTG